MNFYSDASNIVKLVKNKEASTKNLVYSSNQQNKKALYALVCESLRYYNLMSEVLERTSLLKHEKALKKNTHLGVVLLYEHLLGKGLTGKCQDIIKRHKSSIHSQCELMKVRAKVTSLRELVVNSEDDTGLTLPKYVRVNTIKTDIDHVVREFTEQGWTHVPCSKESFKEVVSTLKKTSFTTDPHIPNVLVFPPTTDFHDNRMYSAGEIILQDKASCFPAYLLSPLPGSHVIDCCAAPGNKTSHLAAMMENKGNPVFSNIFPCKCILSTTSNAKDQQWRRDAQLSITDLDYFDRKVYAFDRDPKRLATLENMIQRAGASCVSARCQDFLTVNPEDSRYRDVEYVLVDPSCSGSGMMNRRRDEKSEDEIPVERLEHLSKFQITILKHAFKFPKVKRILYSTCSLHEKENEQVVEEVISSVSQNFKMRLLLPDWSERGVGGYEHAHCCLRMSHDSALTNGFFVACFERKGNGERQSNGTEMDLAQEEMRSMNNVDQIKDKHKKRKKLKHKSEDDDMMNNNSQISENTDMTLINSISRKRKHLHQDNDVMESTGKTLDYNENHNHRNSCKKKKKKSKQRDIIVDSNKNDFETETELKHNNSCRKKRKKSKQREIDNGMKVKIEPKTSNSCKKKRKKSKQRDIVEGGAYTSKNCDSRHSNNCRKKRKKSKQRDLISENHHNGYKRLKKEIENRYNFM